MSYSYVYQQALAGPVDDLAQELYQSFLSYAKPAVEELTDTAIAQARKQQKQIVDEITDQATDRALERARGQIDSVTDQVFASAKPKIEQIAQEAITSGAIGTELASAKKQLVLLAAGTAVGTALLTYALVKLL